MRQSRTGWLAVVVLSLAGCFGGGEPVRKSVFPPRASLQQLTVQPDASWKLQLRLQNYSSVSMVFAHADAKIEIAGEPAGEIAVSPALRIGPESADAVETVLRPTPAAARAIEALHGSGSVHYKLSGRIATSEPSGDRPYTFEGVLTPVPGLTGVLR